MLFSVVFLVRACMEGAASQAGDAVSSRAPGLTSGLQGSVNVHRGALLLVPQWQCISSFVFYIVVRNGNLIENTPVSKIHLLDIPFSYNAMCTEYNKVVMVMSVCTSAWLCGHDVD